MGLFGRVIVGMMPFTPRFIINWVAKRYVAGPDLDSAIRLMSVMSAEDACFTVDVLGEEIATLDESQFFIDEYSRLIDAIADSGLDANLSIKPTAFGFNHAQEQLLLGRVIRIHGCLRHFSFSGNRIDRGSFVTASEENLARTNHDVGHFSHGHLVLSIPGRTRRLQALLYRLVSIVDRS